MGKITKKNNNIGTILNVVIALVGVVIIISGCLLKVCGCGDLAVTILISVGTSILATAIVSFLTSRYLIKTNNTKNIIDVWKLNNLYNTKSDMNLVSNEYLDKCKECIDIMAIGMSSFISYKGDKLKELINKGVKIRILSCGSKEQLEQRESDENYSGAGKTTGRLYNEVVNLGKWIDEIKKLNPDAGIEIRYHLTYPAFSYLRIDTHAFWGPDLCMKQSQLSPACEFDKGGTGFETFQKYFDELWDNKLLVKNHLK